MVVPSAFSWSGVFRAGDFNFDCQQEDQEEDHGHHDTEQPDCYAVFSEFALSPEGRVLRPAIAKTVEVLIRFFSGAIISVAVLPSEKSVSP